MDFSFGISKEKKLRKNAEKSSVIDHKSVLYLTDLVSQLNNLRVSEREEPCIRKTQENLMKFLVQN